MKSLEEDMSAVLGLGAEVRRQESEAADYIALP
jgi:hypothetical protein